MTTSDGKAPVTIAAILTWVLEFRRLVSPCARGTSEPHTGSRGEHARSRRQPPGAVLNHLTNAVFSVRAFT